MGSGLFDEYPVLRAYYRKCRDLAAAGLARFFRIIIGSRVASFPAAAPRISKYPKMMMDFLRLLDDLRSRPASQSLQVDYFCQLSMVGN